MKHTPLYGPGLFATCNAILSTLVMITFSPDPILSCSAVAVYSLHSAPWFVHNQS